ncbi:MAG: hypothetical protein J7M39_06570, partial [Anaerolineae bacterium]|nr:hypothetical protein [Anaerolineae bacterium]
MQRESLDRGWRFHLGDPPGVPYGTPDDTDWRVVDLPHDWSIELNRTADAPSGDNGGYFQMGRGWYRRTFAVPENWIDRSVFVQFEGIYQNAEIWINEDFVARHPYGYTSFNLDITPYVTIGPDNVLTVKVDNAAQKNSRWYSGSGIYRHVWLLAAEPVHVAHWGICITTPQVSTAEATVEIATTLNNDETTAARIAVRSYILTQDGATLAGTGIPLTIPGGQSQVCSQRLTVANPRLWSCESPYLYRIETDVLVDGAV